MPAADRSCRQQKIDAGDRGPRSPPIGRVDLRLRPKHLTVQPAFGMRRETEFLCELSRSMAHRYTCQLAFSGENVAASTFEV
jgi:hypothetical protein